MMHEYRDIQLIFNREDYREDREYWQQILEQPLTRVTLPNEASAPLKQERESERATLPINIPRELAKQAVQLGKHNDVAIFIILLTALKVFLRQFTRNEETLIQTPLLKVGDQKEAQRRYNRFILLRDQIDASLTVKQLLTQTRTQVLNAYRHQDFPLELALGKRDEQQREALIFSRVSISLEQIHHVEAEIQATSDWSLALSRREDSIEGICFYTQDCVEEEDAGLWVSLYRRTLDWLLHNLYAPLSGLADGMFDSKERLLHVLVNHSQGESVHRSPDNWLSTHALETPHRVALERRDVQLTFQFLDRQVSRLASLMERRDIGRGDVAAVLCDDDIQRVVGMLASMRQQTVYLPIDSALPRRRVEMMLKDSNASGLITSERQIQDFSFMRLTGIIDQPCLAETTDPRPQVRDLDLLGTPDRSLVSYKHYQRRIGQAMVTNSISLQWSRGCVYRCAYCFKIWSEKYVMRSAEHIFSEIKACYDQGVRRFNIVDDLPNIDIKNSSRLFRMIIDHGLKLHLHFPNGIRGDILTEELIDLMVEAGSVTMDLALETASPRLQKLVRKHLDLDRLQKNIRYITENYPQVILELQILHGIPTETEAEALQSLDLIKNIQWVHFPYIHVLNIYPGSEMARIAIEHGVPEEAIRRSADMAYHELPETLPFDHSFSRRFQAEFLEEYFLNKERLLAVLPHQMKVLTEDELVQKYDSYLPVEIGSFLDLLDYAGIGEHEIEKNFLPDDFGRVADIDQKFQKLFPQQPPSLNAFNILLLDVTQYFASTPRIRYDVVEPPLGLLCVMSYLKQQLGAAVNGKIAKSGIDYKSFDDLRHLVEEFKPDIIGIRGLNFFRDFFHQTVAELRRFGVRAPIVAGGPYATSSYRDVLKDPAVDVCVLGEGEITFFQLVDFLINNNRVLPDDDILRNIPGLAFVPNARKSSLPENRRVLFMEDIPGNHEPGQSYRREDQPLTEDPAYIIYTSGSTGIPKGVVVTRENLCRQISALQRVLSADASLRTLLLAAPGFDVWMMHTSLAVTCGGRLVTVPGEIKTDGNALWGYVARRRVNLLNTVPALLESLLSDDVPQDINLRWLLVGGARFSSHLYRKIFESNLRIRQIINIYGPTETTINAAYYQCENPIGPIPIGTPLPDYEIAVVDSRMNILPPGIVGELCIGGSGVAAGYLNRPELTSELFKSHPRFPSRQIYKSGDLGRIDFLGRIQYLGRVDRQMKVRGIRIEPEEIERVIAGWIPEAAIKVALRKRHTGDHYLCAYIETKEQPDLGSLRRFLEDNLPAAVIPSYFVLMEHFPLNANGKVDERQLPDPWAAIETSSDKPLDRVESGLRDLWADVVGLDFDQVGMTADFFQIGGHSLHATIIISRIHKLFSVRLHLEDFFKSSTIRSLAQVIKSRTITTYTDIDPAEKKEYYPLSHAQKRLYFMQHMQPESSAYNLPLAVRLWGDLDIERLESIFRQLIQRHQSLRIFFLTHQGQVYQREHPRPPFHIERVEADADLEECVQSFIRHFDLTKPPLMRVSLCRTGERDYVLMVDVHHIVADGLSTQVLIREFLALYEGRHLPPLTIQYLDFADWQNSVPIQREMKRQESFWMERFAGGVPVLELPLDFPRASQPEFIGNTVKVPLDPSWQPRLRAAAEGEGATMYMVVLAMCYLWLAKLSSQDHIVIGLTTGGRTHPALEPMIGMFANTLAVNVEIDRQKTFRQFLRQVKKETLEAFDNQDYPFEDLVDTLLPKRDPSRNPLFDVAFGWWEEDAAVTTDGVQLENLEIEALEYENRSTLFDMLVSVVDENNRLSLSLEYCTKLFSKRTIDHWLDYFGRIVEQVLEDMDRPLEHIDCFQIDRQLERRLVEDWGTHPGNYPPDTTVSELFRRQAGRTPDAVALTDGGQLTYRELERSARWLADELRALGIGAGHLVPIMLDRSNLMIVGMLGTALSGAAYVPIDPGYPAPRVQFILDDVASPVILTKRALANDLQTSSQPVYIDDILHREPEAGDTLPQPAADHPLYVIYTSGTTGTPKGVVVSHRNVVRLLIGDRFQFDFHASDHWTMFHSYCFDFSVWEMYGALLYGGRLAVVPRLTAMDSRGFLQFLRTHAITILNQTPSAFYRLLEAESALPDAGLNLRTVIFGGEALDPSRLRPFARRYPQAQLINMYGITETTVHVTYKRLSMEDLESGASLIGRPIPTLKAYVLDKGGRLLPPGMPGELTVGGDGVALGYLNRPELTARRFIQSPFHPNDTLYRSGDLARWTYDGELEYKGRIDSQIKIRGYRIETAEVEHCLASHPQVRTAVVVPGSGNGGEHYLVAYVVAGKTVDRSELKHYTEGRLPSYMIPSLFCFVDQIPLTANGKVDRRALPDPTDTGAGNPVEQERLDSVEEEVTGQWAEILQLPSGSLERHVDFFTLGGHSLRATVLIAQLEDRFGVRIPIPVFFNNPTIAGMARYIKAKQRQDKDESLRYWTSYLEGFDRRTTVPHKIENGEPAAYEAGSLELRLQESLHEGLVRLAASLHVTVNILLQTMWGVLLARLNLCPEALFGAVVTGRPPQVEDVERMLGVCINTIPVRVRLLDNPRFSTLARTRLREALAAKGFEYQPLEGGLFDHIMAFENFPPGNTSTSVSVGDRTVELTLENSFQQTAYDFNFLVLPGEPLVLKALFNLHCFRHEDVQSLLQRLCRMVAQLVERPDTPVGEIHLLAEGERREILHTLCRGEDRPLESQTIDRLFGTVAAQYPDRPAAVGLSFRAGSHCQLTYNEMKRQADRLAEVLSQKGVTPGEIVAVLAKPSIEIAVAVMAILKAGAVYLPIDPALPEERIEYMIEDAGAKLVMVSGGQKTDLPPSIAVIYFEEVGARERSQPRPSNVEDPNAAAYVIYTSGSTGRPKGVAVSHHSLLNLCCWHRWQFDVSVGDRASQYASLGFDASVWEMFPYWLAGAAVVFAAQEVRPDMVQLSAFFARHAVTIAFLPTPVYELFRQSPNPGLRLVLTGGDTLRKVNRQSYRVFNNYGPTENTVVSTSVLLTGEEAQIPIGRPIDNCRVYVLDEFFHPQPRGIAGEVWLGGDSLALGYLNRPQLTAERFTSVPGLPDERLYRSGDLGLWNGEGNLEFLGRVDKQVKIRGYRIELEEIEALILDIPGVRQAAAQLLKPAAKDPLLIAYVAMDGALSAEEIKEQLTTQLPAYMIPARFIQLEALPLTVNGKIDRASLPAPDDRQANEGEPPRNKVEFRLRELWGDTLGLAPETIHVTSGFFQLGGHSLHAATLVAMIQKEFSVQIKLADFFQRDSIRGLGDLINESGPSAMPVVEKAEPRDVYPLTAAQKRIYILQMMEPELTAYNMPMVIRLDQEIDPNKVEQTLSTLIRRHHSLSSAFGAHRGQPAQWMEETVQFTLDAMINVDDDISLQRHLEDFIRPFDLTRPPMIRALIIQINEARLLAVDVHHIAADGISLHILEREFQSLLRGETLPPLELEYKDVALWQQGIEYQEALRRQERYWLERFRRLPEHLPLPTDGGRPEVRDFSGAQESGKVRAAELKGLRELAARSGSTLFMALAAVCFALLHRLSGQQDIVVGTPVAGRRLREFQQIVGMFVGTLPLRAEVKGEMPFADLMEQVKELSIQAFENQDYPFEQLVEKLRIPRDPGRNPLFDMMFALQNFVDGSTEAEKNGIHQDLMEFGAFKTVSRFDMTWSLALDNGDLYIDVEYSRRLFNPSTIQGFIADFKRLAIAAGHNPNHRLSGFHLESPTALERKIHNHTTAQQRIEPPQQSTPPCSQLEETMVELWSRVLSIPAGEIDMNADFFALGGHSLAAGQLVNRIAAETGISIPWMQIFKTPTVRSLAAFMAGQDNSVPESIRPREKQDYYPATPQQKRMVALQALDPQSTVYNLQLHVKIEAGIQIEQLQEILDSLTDRHESLRTYFQIVDNQPLQRVVDKTSIPIQPIDRLSAAIRPFDLSSAPLARAFLTTADGDSRMLALDMHHIITDGWSVGVLQQEFSTLLNGRDLLSQPLQYRDFACWWGTEQQQETLKQQRDFWLNTFVQTVTPLELPYDRPRPQLKDPAGAMVTFSLSAADTQTLERLAHRHTMTMFMMTLSLLYILLYRLSGQEDIVIGAPVDGRSHPQTEGMVGLFVNTLAVRRRVAGHMTVSALLTQVKEGVSQALQNRDFPFDQLVEAINIQRDPSRNPLFDIMLSWLQFDVPTQDSPQTIMEEINPVARFDMTWGAQMRDDRLEMGIEYSTALFDRATIQRFASYFKRIAAAVVKRTELPINKIAILSPKEREELTRGFNTTSCPYPSQRAIHRLFEEVVDTHADKIALALPDEYRHISYSQLNREANTLARRLITGGLAQGAIVAILARRGFWKVVSILAIQKAGCAYLPLDSDAPPQRLEFMLRDSGAVCLVVDMESPVPGFEGTIIRSDVEIGTDEDGGNLEIEVTADAPLYVIYTSGTTGQPKGVVVEHGNVAQLMINDRHPFQFSSADIWTMFHSYCFDFSVWEMYGPLLYGGKLLPIPRWLATDPASFAAVLEREAVTVLNQTPSAFYNLIHLTADAGHSFSPLKMVIFGGEALNPQKLRAWSRSHPHVRLVNMFGITETTVHASIHPLTAADLQSPVSIIGGPIPNHQLYVLDWDLELLPRGCVGELFVGGAGVTRGYLNRPELTAERFVPHPFHPGERIYKSGDRGRYCDQQGNLEHLGRGDQQVKIRGFRVEPGEIERALLDHPVVAEAVVLPHADSQKDTILIAYIVPSQHGDGERQPSADDMRAYLGNKVPAYMIPAEILFIDGIPLTANGKLDRSALPEPGGRPIDRISYPQTDREREIVGIWAEILGLPEEKISIDLSFWQLGGHSLKAALLADKLNRRFKISQPLRHIYSGISIRQLANLIHEEPIEGERSSSLGAIKLTDHQKGNPQLVFIHGAAGDVRHYFQLAQLLPKGIGTWAIPAAERPHPGPWNTSMKEIANHYIEVVEQISNGDSIVLVGWSSGALMALEMALQMEAENLLLQNLILIDSPPPPHTLQSTSPFTPQMETKFIQRHLKLDLPALGLMNEEDLDILSIWHGVTRWLSTNNDAENQARRMIRQQFGLPVNPDEEIDINQLLAIANRMRSFQRASRNYTPRGTVAAPSLVIKAKDSKIQDIYDWRTFFTSAIEILELPGNHHSMFQPPHAQPLAEAIGDFLTETRRRRTR